jgi:hypothetical protein
LTKKYKSVRIGNKVRKVSEDTYSRWQENARKQGLTMEAYLDRVIIEDEATVVPKGIAKHFRPLENLFTEYVDPSFSEVFTYLRPILLKAMKLDKEKRKEFIEDFITQLEKVLDSMSAHNDKKGEDEV